MFEVRTKSPMDDRWLERDDEIISAAGSFGSSTFSGAGVGSNECGGRDHGWEVSDFASAQELKRQLDEVEGVTATIREK